MRPVRSASPDLRQDRRGYFVRLGFEILDITAFNEEADDLLGDAAAIQAAADAVRRQTERN